MKTGVIFFVSVRMCVVQLRCDSSEIICCRLFRASTKNSRQGILCLNRAATANKSDQKSVRHDARAVRAE